MGFANHNHHIGKYQLGRLIGEGAFAKVKLATDLVTGRHAAIKIIDKQGITNPTLMEQVKREIRTMKLLHHPNIVRIFEVIGTKSKIYIAMEYVSGGQLSDKLSYLRRMTESEARRLFQQLIDAVDYCHGRGVYHRDLKPENLLLDSKGNLKVSDFGLSTLRKPGDMLLSTACGSPSYVAPEVLLSKGYDGSAADIWSCGVILFELLAGALPFDDRNLMNLYRKICRAEYSFPAWFTKGQKALISRMFDVNPKTRITVPGIVEEEWFRTDYVPAHVIQCDDEDINLDDVHAAFDSIEERDCEQTKSNFINAFQLIAMSHDLNLSGLFEEHEDVKERTRIGSENTLCETMRKIEDAAKDVSLSVERMNNKIKIHPKPKMVRNSRSHFNLSAEVIEVAPTHCVVEISKSAGKLGVYREFIKSAVGEDRAFPIKMESVELRRSKLTNAYRRRTGWTFGVSTPILHPRVIFQTNQRTVTQLVMDSQGLFDATGTTCICQSCAQSRSDGMLSEEEEYIQLI